MYNESMVKWIIIAILAGLVVALYFYTAQTKDIIDAAVKLLA